MNTSARTLSDLKSFARAEPGRAAEYLREVEGQLRSVGKTSEAQQLSALLTDGMGTLFERIERQAAALTSVFPTNEADWGAVQLSRAATVGYAVHDPAPAASFISGTLEAHPAGGFLIKTEGGRELKVSTSSRVLAKGENLPLSLISGFLGDGRLSFQGTLGEDRASFNLEGFALDLDGSFKTFTFGRVKQDGSGVITSPRGDVTVEDPVLLQKLKAMKGLAVILPGAAELKAGALVYSQSPKAYFGLGRWQDVPTGTGETRECLADMAFSVFRSKPVELPAKYEGRAGHANRLWLLGDVTLDEKGKPSRFTASYVSQNADEPVPLEPTTPDADPVQAAVMHELV